MSQYRARFSDYTHQHNLPKHSSFVHNSSIHLYFLNKSSNSTAVLKLLDQINQLKLKLKTLKLKLILSELQSKFLKNDTVLSNITDRHLLVPFPRVSFPFCFHSITGIDYIYHPQLYHNHDFWIMISFQSLNCWYPSFV